MEFIIFQWIHVEIKWKQYELSLEPGKEVTKLIFAFCFLYLIVIHKNSDQNVIYTYSFDSFSCNRYFDIINMLGTSL